MIPEPRRTGRGLSIAKARFAIRVTLPSPLGCCFFSAIDIFRSNSDRAFHEEDGIAQVNKAVVEIDATTQQNAALVEEAAAAASSLRNQADTLRSLVSAFRLHAQEAAHDTASPAALQDQRRLVALR
jgi:hypothetical protein